MSTLIKYLSDLIGIDTFWRQLPQSGSSGYTSYQWDYGAMLQYVCCVLIIIVVIKFVFGCIKCFFKR